MDITTLYKLYNEHISGKSITNAPANLALAASVELVLLMARRSGASQQTMLKLKVVHDIANIGINGLDNQSSEQAKVKFREILDKITAARQKNLIELSSETEGQIEDMKGVLSGAASGAASGALNHQHFSASQFLASVVLGALDGALAEVPQEEGQTSVKLDALRSAVTTAKRILELTSNPASFNLQDLKDAQQQLKKIRKQIKKRIHSHQEEIDLKHAFESIFIESIRMDINSDLTNDLIKKALQEISTEQNTTSSADYRYFYKNTADGNYELYKSTSSFNAKEDPIATCQEPKEKNKPYIMKVTVPVDKAVGLFFKTLTAKRLSLSISYCPSATALEQLIGLGATITITSIARDNLITKYATPPLPADGITLSALKVLLNKVELQAASTHHTSAKKLSKV